jgi:hypothetical protein
VPLEPRPLAHVGEAAGPEVRRAWQHDHQHIHLGPLAGDLVREPCREPGPVHEGLLAWRMPEVARGTSLLGLLREHLAERLVGVGKLALGRGLLAVLHPEQLDGQLAVPLLALDERRQVWLQVGSVAWPPGPGEELRVDRRGIHGLHGGDREAALLRDPRGLRHIALADVLRSRDGRLAHPSPQQGYEDLLHLGHRHAPFC